MSLSTSLPSPPPVLSEDPDEIDEELAVFESEEDLLTNLTTFEDPEDVAGAVISTYDQAIRERQALAISLQLGGDDVSTSSAHTESIKNNDVKMDPNMRLQYLMDQSEVFAHFLAGTNAETLRKSQIKKRGRKSKEELARLALEAEKTPKKEGGLNAMEIYEQDEEEKKNAAKTPAVRMSEEAEDASMMATATSKRTVTRIDKQPVNLSEHCKMHPYQLEGLNWLIKLHDNAINGILADEMGLGKTLQTISLLAYLRSTRGIRGQHIVICPKIVTGNWIREFRKWCPHIRALRLLGTKDERSRIMKEDFPADKVTGKYKWDVLVTSYEGVLKEKSILTRFKWNYLIIDEAHRIKNETSALSQVVRKMQTQFRLLITGTPLQNNLHELWALLNFLLPEIFSEAQIFDEWFSMEGEEGQKNVIKKLHTVLRPFMLRRVKTDVAKALPPKKETKLYIGLTAMQQEWYMKILTKDAHELNALGGPDKMRLLNVLMQLRKVCNHPYLFDGAEPGPPFFDGPHLWENSGKMQLLHKLLSKLKSKGSRVLIFSQMTRVLDILEDYVRLVGYQYCRIDGNTDGEKRDDQMDEYNAPGSTKFIFLLSTRAGGLGINLHTADIVILYDSDWNPQVDLQAMDRAHRIGQTKPVQVFRFVAEGTVEEKIIERADKKLFLDAAVIQQGRLAEQNSSVDKRDLMSMVRFGADQILNKKGGTYTDEDIDALIARGEERTIEQQAKLVSGQHNLASFSLQDEDDSLFTFQGEDYKGKEAKGNFINLPMRERKGKNYSEFDERENGGGVNLYNPTVHKTAQRRPRAEKYDFQFFDNENFELISKRESDIKIAKDLQTVKIRELRKNSKFAPLRNSAASEDEKGFIAEGESQEEILEQIKTLQAELSSEKYQLTAEEQILDKKTKSEGFGEWSKKDFTKFCSALETFGPYEVQKIAVDVMISQGKPLSEVKRYYKTFMFRYKELESYDKIWEKVNRQEAKIARGQEIAEALEWKVKTTLETGGGDFRSMKLAQIPYGAKWLQWTREEDAYIVFGMHRFGFELPNSFDRMRVEIKNAWQFRMDWFLKSRTTFDLQRRGETLITEVEREYDDFVELEVEKTTAAPAPALEAEKGENAGGAGGKRKR